MMYHMTYRLFKVLFLLTRVTRTPYIFFLTSICGKMEAYNTKWSDSGGKENPLISAEPAQHQHAEILAALERSGWQLDAEEPHVIEASAGERYGVAVFFERGVPVEICYGDGELDLQHSEAWTEAPGLLGPGEVARLFGAEEGEQG
jgi:hypothetical protein